MRGRRIFDHVDPNLSPAWQDEPEPSELECMEQPDECAGEVLLRWPGYGEGAWPRCEYHGEQRLQREDAAIDRYGNPDSPCEPEGFDEMDAGERWEAA